VMSYLQKRLHDDRRSLSSSGFSSTVRLGSQWLWQADCSAPAFAWPVVVNSTSYAFYQGPVINRAGPGAPADLSTCRGPADPLVDIPRWTRLRGPVRCHSRRSTWPCASAANDAQWWPLRTSPCWIGQSAGGTGDPTPSSLTALLPFFHSPR